MSPFPNGWKVHSVVEPATAELISYEAAVKQGVILPGQGLYHNTQTGQTITIEKAMQHGLIEVSSIPVV